MAEAEILVRAVEVEKRYASVVAVNGVTLEVRAGEIFALLGPNGAGKTTLVRMLLGLIHPDRGEIRYGDRPGARTLPAREVGYLPEDRGLYPDVEVLRTLVHFGVLRGMDRAAAGKAAEGWLERLDLGARMREPLRALSKGNQQKVQFISAVLHGPRFAVLDEPFSGLDPLNQDLFLTMIRELAGAGTTVLLSAHQMQLVERLADRIMVLKQGESVLSGTLAEIRRRWQTGQRLTVRVKQPFAPGFLATLEGVNGRLLGDGGIELFVAEGQPLGPVLVALGSELEITEIESHPVTLHDVYVRAVGSDREPVPEGGVAL